MSSTITTSGTVSAITVDGSLSDWTTAERIDNPANFVTGYALYGTVQDDTYFIAIQATTTATAPVIGPGTTIWLNTDQNTVTGYTPFDSIGADYNITYVNGAFYLYTGAAGQSLVSSTPLSATLSADGKSLEIAIPRALITPASGPAPTNINIAAQIDNAVYLPGDYNNPEYTITDPATLLPKTTTHKVAIVYSDTSAKLYFSQTAYSDLIMAAENQARMAGVSFDIIDETKLTDINNLIGYDALIFPAMPDVDTTQLPAIMATLTSAVYNYHIGIITAGDFLTNDQTGVALPGNSYANMETLLDLARYTGGNSGNVTVSASDLSNPIMQGYTAGQVIQSYTNEGYAAYQGIETPADVLVTQTVAGLPDPLPGVVQTTTGGTNVHFATADLLGGSNLLSHAIQSVVTGTQPGVVLDTSRQAGIVAVRMDMDQSQFPVDVSPTGGGLGIYGTLIPILQQWKLQYNFVGSYYINIGDAPTAADQTTTNWSVSLPYYQALEAMGGEIGNHSYTHLINPPTTTMTAKTTSDTPAGSFQVTLDSVPSFYGITVGMTVTGLNIGTNTPLPGAAGEAGGVASTTVTAVSGNTVTLSYVPGGYGTLNDGVLGLIPAGTTLTFGIPAENTNFLQTGTGTVTGSLGDPFTYDYEFNQSRLIEQTQLGHVVYGAAIPGASETFATDQNILPYYQSVDATTTTSGYTGYLTGGWTGVGSSYPGAIGYMSPTDQSSIYIAPNMTFDFTEIQYQGKTLAEAEQDWANQFAALTANAVGTPIVVLPVHDYGVAAWNTTTDTGSGSPYATSMYTDFIAHAYASNYEFVTLEELASRYAAQQKAAINYTTVGNTINATVTPDPTAPDLGAMALNVINGGTNVIESVTNWYAYNQQDVFLPSHGGSFTVNLGATQDDLTHITALPMRADLISVTGDGVNLGFSMLGDGQVVIDLKDPTANIVSVQGAPTASLTGDLLNLTFADTLVAPTYVPLLHTVSVEQGATEFATAGNDIIIGTLGNDLLTSPGGGNDTIIGHGGTDTVAYNGASTDYRIVTNSDGSETVTDLRLGSPDGTDTLIGITNIVYKPALASIVASGTGIINGAGDVGLGSVVTLTVNFNEAMIVSGGSPTLTFNDGGVATYTGGSGTNALTFSYAVAAGQNTPDLVISSFDLPTGVTVQTLAGTSFDPTAATNYNPSGILQIDTTAPVETAAIISMTNDSGVPGDFITNIGLAGRTVSGTVSASLPADETVQVSFDNGATWSAAAVTGTAWSAIDSSSHAASWTIEARVSDLAGNSGTTASRSVTLDTTPPSASVALAPASDSGLSNTDSITKVTKPTFTGTTDGGSTVVLFDGKSQIGTSIATATGQWSISTVATLASGTHSITAQVTDIAGNVGVTPTPLSVVIDTVAPAAPTAPDLLAASDSGTSQTDNLTSIATPIFSGSAEVGSTVTLFDGATAIGTGIAATGSWSIATSTLTDGTHSITAKATDVAGNVGAASGALSVKIDTKAPLASSPDLIATSDTGASSTDNITKTTTPTFTGTAEVGSAVRLLDGSTQIGSATASASGSWTITAPVLGQGTHAITTTATDAAGNTSAPSAALSVMIDTTAPSSPAFSGLTANSNGSATFAGSAEPSSIVTVFDLSAQLGTATVGGTGVWSFKTAALSDTLHVFTASATDQAGNIGGIAGSAQFGSSAADILTSTSGNDTLMGRGGADTFSFLANFANDIISDFAATGAGHDVINFHANSVLNSFASVLGHAVQSGSSVVISQDASDTLTLKNVTLGSLNSSAFTFG